MDYFSQLLTLRLSEVVPAELLTKASRTNQVDGATAYYFDSELYSRPHGVTLNENGLLTELSLTIPQAKRQEYQQQLKSLGEPETTKPLGEVEQIFAFPSKGMTFVVGKNNQPLKIVMAQPTTKEAFIAEKLDPIPTSSTLVTAFDDSGATLPAGMQVIDQKPVPSTSPLFFVFGIAVFVGLLIWLFLARKRRVQSSRMTQPPSVLPPTL